MAGGLYLGREVDAASGALGERIELDPADLLTHGLIVGMTGSGKTGLAVALIEELLRRDVPVLAIDPKGDLGNLLLLFDNPDAASLAPWIDADAARRQGKDPQAAAGEAAAQWQKGLAEWGLGPADVAALRASHDAVIYTPGSEAGVPLNILQSLDAPAVPFASAEEDLRDEIAGIVSGMLGLVHIEADPLRSREFILLSNLIEHAWRAGKGLTLESLIPAVADPPFEKLGALPVESVFPRKDRHGLMMALNNLLASPGFESWREGEPLDIERMLRTPEGRPRLSIVYTAHLAEEERLFVTALLLDKVKTWMRRQSGTTGLRALVYMDEIYGYFPPHPANPATKRPLLTLLKQARAQGVGVVLATQNPVDLDYKGLANMGLWLVGRLQTEQDRARLLDGLVGAGVDAGAIDRLLSATRKRVFLLHDVHRKGPTLIHSRWAMSFLRGPLTRVEVGRLMAGRTAAPSPLAAGAAAPPSRAEKGAPVLPAGIDQHYLPLGGGAHATPFLLVKYAVRYKGLGETIAARAYPVRAGSVAEILEGDPIAVDEARLVPGAPAGITYAEVPAAIAETSARALEKAIKERLADKLTLSLWIDPLTRTVSNPGESKEGLAARVGSLASGGTKAAKLHEKLDKKRRDLQAREQELSGRSTEKWASLGSAVLTGVLGRGRGGLSGATSVLTKNRMENAAEKKVEALKAEVAALEREVAAVAAVDPARIQPHTLVPARTQTKLLRHGIVWVS